MYWLLAVCWLTQIVAQSSFFTPIATYTQNIQVGETVTHLNTALLECNEHKPGGSLQVGNITLRVQCIPPRYNYHYTHVANIPRRVNNNRITVCLVADKAQWNASRAALALQKEVNYQIYANSTVPNRRRLLSQGNQTASGSRKLLGVIGFLGPIGAGINIDQVEGRLDEVDKKLKSVDGELTLVNSVLNDHTNQIKNLNAEVISVGAGLNSLQSMNVESVHRENLLKANQDSLLQLFNDGVNSNNKAIKTLQDAQIADRAALEQQVKVEFETIGNWFLTLNGNMMTQAISSHNDIKTLFEGVESNKEDVLNMMSLLDSEMKKTQLRRLLITNYYAARRALPSDMKPFVTDDGAEPFSDVNELTGADLRILIDRMVINYNMAGILDEPALSNSFTIIREEFNFYIAAEHAIEFNKPWTRFEQLLKWIGPDVNCKRPFVASDGQQDPDLPPLSNYTCIIWIEVTRTYCTAGGVPMPWNNSGPGLPNEQSTAFPQQKCLSPQVQTVSRVLRSIQDFTSYINKELCMHIVHASEHYYQVRSYRLGLLLYFGVDDSKLSCPMTMNEMKVLQSSDPTAPVLFSLILAMLNRAYTGLIPFVAQLELKKYGRLPGGVKITAVPFQYTPTRKINGDILYDGGADPTDCFVAEFASVSRDTVPVMSLIPFENHIIDKEIIVVKLKDPCTIGASDCYIVRNENITNDLPLLADASHLLPANLLVVGDLTDAMFTGIWDVPEHLMDTSITAAARANTVSYIMMPPDVTTTLSYEAWQARFENSFDPTLAAVSAHRYNYPASTDVNNYPICDLNGAIPYGLEKFRDSRCDAFADQAWSYRGVTSPTGVFLLGDGVECNALDQISLHYAGYTELSLTTPNPVDTGAFHSFLAGTPLFNHGFTLGFTSVYTGNGTTVAAIEALKLVGSGTTLSFGVLNGKPSVKLQDSTMALVPAVQSAILSDLAIPRSYSFSFDSTSQLMRVYIDGVCIGYYVMNTVAGVLLSATPITAPDVYIQVKNLWISDQSYTALQIVTFNHCVYRRFQKRCAGTGEVTKSAYQDVSTPCLAGTLIHATASIIPPVIAVSQFATQAGTLLFRTCDSTSFCPWSISFWLHSKQLTPNELILQIYDNNGHGLRVEFTDLANQIRFFIKDPDQHNWSTNAANAFVATSDTPFSEGGTFVVFSVQDYSTEPTSSFDGVGVRSIRTSYTETHSEVNVEFASSVTFLKYYQNTYLSTNEATSERLCEIRAAHDTPSYQAVNPVFIPPFGFCVLKQEGDEFGFCRQPNLCQGRCMAYAAITGRQFLPLTHICDDGWSGADCSVRCTLQDEVSGACRQKPLQKVNIGEQPSGVMCGVLKEFKASKTTFDTLPVLTLEPRYWTYSPVSIQVPSGLVSSLVTIPSLNSSCPLTESKPDNSGGVFLAFTNTASDYIYVQVKYFPDNLVDEAACVNNPCCNLFSLLYLELTPHFVTPYALAGCNQTVTVEVSALSGIDAQTSANVYRACATVKVDTVAAIAKVVSNYYTVNNVDAATLQPAIVYVVDKASQDINNFGYNIVQSLIALIAAGARADVQGLAYIETIKDFNNTIANARLPIVNFTDLSHSLAYIPNATLLNNIANNNKEFDASMERTANLTKQLNETIAYLYKQINESRILSEKTDRDQQALNNYTRYVMDAHSNFLDGLFGGITGKVGGILGAGVHAATDVVSGIKDIAVGAVGGLAGGLFGGLVSGLSGSLGGLLMIVVVMVVLVVMYKLGVFKSLCKSGHHEDNGISPADLTDLKKELNSALLKIEKLTTRLDKVAPIRPITPSDVTIEMTDVSKTPQTTKERILELRAKKTKLSHIPEASPGPLFNANRRYTSQPITKLNPPPAYSY